MIKKLLMVAMILSLSTTVFAQGFVYYNTNKASIQLATDGASRIHPEYSYSKDDRVVFEFVMPATSNVLHRQGLIAVATPSSTALTYEGVPFIVGDYDKMKVQYSYAKDETGKTAYRTLAERPLYFCGSTERVQNGDYVVNSGVYGASWVNDVSATWREEYTKISLNYDYPAAHTVLIAKVSSAVNAAAVPANIEDVLAYPAAMLLATDTPSWYGMYTADVAGLEKVYLTVTYPNGGTDISSSTPYIRITLTKN